MASLDKTRGFTLIELMVTVAVLAIVLSIAIPSFSAIILNNRLSTTADELQSSLQLARSEAVKRKKTITLCRADASFEKCAESGTDWSLGWLLLSGGEGGEVLKIWEPSSGLVIEGPATSAMILGTGMPQSSYTFKVNAPQCSNGVQHVLEMNRIGSLKARKGAC